MNWFTRFLKSIAPSTGMLSNNRGETNVAYASDDTSLENLVLHTLPNFGPHGDGITNNNFLFALMKAKDGKEGSSKRFQVLDGGLEFWNGIMTRENTNFKWQGKTSNMTAQLQDPNKRLRFPVKAFTGSIVLNEMDKAQNKGRAMMKNFARDQREQADATIPNLFNSAFWNTSPGTDEPESIPSIISITPTTGTIGGLSRSGEPALQNGVVTTAIADIGSEAGIAAIQKEAFRVAVGSGGKNSPDIAIMDESNFAGMVGYLANLNRYRPDDTMAQLGFDTIKLGNLVYSYENTNVLGGANTITTGYVYLINSNHLKFKVLRDGNFKWDPKGFIRVGTSLNTALYFWVFCNLDTNNPRAHSVFTNVSST